MNEARSSRRSAEEGAAAIEAAFIVPLLLLMMFGTVECARAFWTYHRMLLALEDAGRYAMVYAASPSLLNSITCPSVTTVTLANCAVARANSYLASSGATGVSVSSSQDSATPPNLTIAATCPFNFLLPALLPYGPITLTSQVKVPLV
jgi:Flp pilus assembly protein TadG